MKLPNQAKEYAVVQMQSRLLDEPSSFPFAIVDNYQLLLEDEKARKSFIKKIESHVRGSIEYKDYVKFLKQTVGLNKCSFFPNLTTEVKGNRLELHHAPFTLFDTVDIILEHILKNEPREFSAFTIVHEVVKAHYENLVGLIPLSETVHELVHAGKLSIKLDQIFGDVRAFMIQYKDGVTIDHLNLLNQFHSMSKTEGTSSTDILKINPLLIAELPERLGVVLESENVEDDEDNDWEEEPEVEKPPKKKQTKKSKMSLLDDDDEED